MKKLASFEEIMDQISRVHGANQTFTDFLTLCICAFSMGKLEDLYFNTIRKYEKPYAYSFSEALAALVIEMTGPGGDGFVDVLGDYFEKNLSHGKNGQFFTPQPVCDMMARMMNPSMKGERIADPACGSGRMLMAMAKVNRLAWFYGADIDSTCAKMATINLCLNCIYGEIAWMDSLSGKFYAGWEIMPTMKGVPCITPISEKQSLMRIKLPEKVEEITPLTSKQLIFEF
jgi:hypothetical protein